MNTNNTINPNCILCSEEIHCIDCGHPYLIFNGLSICSHCYRELIPEIYKKAGMGDGGLIHLIFKACLQSEHNKQKRSPIRNYKKILNVLLKKYKFQCVSCGGFTNLSIDHIKPVSKGGTDELTNLQILCRACNSRKGNKCEKN